MTMMIRALFAALALALLPAAPAFAQTAVLRGLDKVTGHARDFNAPIGRPVRYGTLEIIARSCVRSPPEEPPETKIFVEVFDHPIARQDEERPRREVFSGWLFASSPGVSAIEHPVYDIWAINCRA
ncbi:MAG: DUF2155 domain-containing protein [Alphaproteobacteria bacterium]|nr:DUF2155 domain-containing protein [Alphaproteobacteria bacterium]